MIGARESRSLPIFREGNSESNGIGGGGDAVAAADLIGKPHWKRFCN